MERTRTAQSLAMQNRKSRNWKFQIPNSNCFCIDNSVKYSSSPFESYQRDKSSANFVEQSQQKYSRSTVLYEIRVVVLQHTILLYYEMVVLECDLGFQASASRNHMRVQDTKFSHD